MPGRAAPFTEPATRARILETTAGTEIYLSAAPPQAGGDDLAQALEVLEGLRSALRAVGAKPTEIVWGTLYLAGTPRWPLRATLNEALGLPAQALTPITALVQPPARPGCFCTVLVKVVRGLAVWPGVTASPLSSTVLRQGNRHLHLLSLVPRSDLGSRISFADLAYDLFARAGHELNARGLVFADVARTWIYVRDLHTHYRELNQARNRFFAEQGLPRIPASTGIGGALAGADVPVSMDLYAVAGAGEAARVAPLAPGPLGEATEYGSAFARGMVVEQGGRRTVYLSGTASIDRAGRVVAVGDPLGQIECMLDNVAALLAQESLGFADLCSATVYLDDPTLRDAFLRAAARRGLAADLPLAIVHAKVCRPEWLCEMECVASRAPGRVE